MPRIVFHPGGAEITVPAGTLIQEAARKAGIEIGIPCGGQGRCGRCAVLVQSGAVRRRSTLRLSAAEVALVMNAGQKDGPQEADSLNQVIDTLQRVGAPSESPGDDVQVVV